MTKTIAGLTMVVMKLPRILNRLFNLIAFTHNPYADARLPLPPSPAKASMELVSSGHHGNIAYRESCRNRNQRKARKNFRRLIAAGGV